MRKPAASALPAGALAPMLSRIDRALVDFAQTLSEAGGLTLEEARAVSAYYRKNRLAKVDSGIGRVNVKHGALLDRDVIRRALSAATA